MDDPCSPWTSGPGRDGPWTRYPSDRKPRSGTVVWGRRSACERRRRESPRDSLARVGSEIGEMGQRVWTQDSGGGDV